MFKKYFSLCIFAVLVLTSSALARQTKKQYWYAMPDDINMSIQNDVFVDLPTASTYTFISGNSVSTTTIVASGVSYTLGAVDYTDIALPRNLVADFAFATGEATTTASGTLLITGEDQFGKTTTESLTMSTNSVTGSKAWSTITSLAISAVTITGASEANVLISIGTGVKIGLSNNTRASTDIIKVVEAGSPSTTYTLNTTYDTIDFAADPDASKDYYIFYNKRFEKSRYQY